jgi:hypothetical protein
MKEEQITDPVEYWEHLLTHFSKRSSSSSSSSSQSHSLVLLGDENTGKKSLLANYLTTSPPSAQMLPSSSLLSYDYLLLSDDQNSSSNSNSNGSSSTSTAASLEFSSKVNVWSLNERNFHQFHGIIFDSVKKNQAKVTIFPLPLPSFYLTPLRSSYQLLSISPQRTASILFNTGSRSLNLSRIPIPTSPSLLSSLAASLTS